MHLIKLTVAPVDIVGGAIFTHDLDDVDLEVRGTVMMV